MWHNELNNPVTFNSQYSYNNMINPFFLQKDNKEVDTFIKQNKHISLTIQELNPHTNMHTLTLNALKIIIERNAEDFLNRLRIVATKENLVDSIKTFYSEYRKGGIIPNIDTSCNDKQEINSGYTLDQEEEGEISENVISISENVKSQAAVEDNEEIIERKKARHLVDKDNENLEYKINEPKSNNSEAVLETFEEIKNLSTLTKWLEFPYQAVMEDRIDLLKLCVKLGYDLRVFRGKERETLLHVAVSKPTVNFEVVEMLLENIDFDTSDESGGAIYKGLHNTDMCEDERLCLVNLFVNAGADLGANNNEETTIYSYLSYLMNDFVL